MSYCPPTTEDQERDNLIETFLKMVQDKTIGLVTVRKLVKEISTEELVNTIHELDGDLCGICHVGQMVRKGGTDVCNACGEKA
jgi:hypothetical protein